MVYEPSKLSDAYADNKSRLKCAELYHEADTEVAIIGGGITGTTAALTLANKNVTTIVLEAKVVAFGGSGRAYGLVLPFPKRPAPYLEKMFGHAKTQQLLSRLETGPDRVFDLIKEHHIECEAVRNGWILGAHSSKAIGKLKDQAEKLARANQPVEYLDKERAQELIGSTRYPGALLDSRCGSINPLLYTRGLASAAIKAGAKIYENSEVVKISEGRKRRWRLETRAGAVEAEKVLHCTNAYTGNIWPGLNKTIVPVRSNQLVSEPLSDNLIRPILPGNHIMTDTRHLFSGIRKLEGGRIHMSTGGSFTNADGKPDKKEASRRLAETFPSLSEIKWEKSWAAWVGMNKEHVPRISRLDDGMWSAIGYSGRGIAFGTLMGEELAKLVQGQSTADLFLPVEPIKPIAFHQFAKFGVVAIAHWYKLLDRLG